MSGYELIGIFLILALALLLGIKSRRQYRCPSCGQVFSHSPVSGMLSPHHLDSRMITCPFCGYSDILLPEKKSKD